MFGGLVSLSARLLTMSTRVRILARSPVSRGGCLSSLSLSFCLLPLRVSLILSWSTINSKVKSRLLSKHNLNYQLLTLAKVLGVSVQLIVPSLSLRTKSFVVLRIFCTVPKVTLISVVKKVSRALDSLIFQISGLLRQEIPVRLRGLSQVSRKFVSPESLCMIVVTKTRVLYNL